MKDFEKTLFVYGFSQWGFYLIKNFFKPKKVVFIHSLQELRKNFSLAESVLIMYPTKQNSEILKFAKEKNIPIGFVEDGFIRSLTLGSSFFKPASIVVDFKGIYYDPSSQNDLEYLLNTYECTYDEIQRSKKLKQTILNFNVSKYNHLQYKKLDIETDKKVALVVGQVDDDMSIQKAGFGFDSFSLLKKVREENPEKYILYKPHPDVIAKIREGFLNIQALEEYADKVVTEVNLDSCFEVSDEVHTISSLSGFEALLRGKKVVVYGLPFYAGWGLTEDKRICKRRIKKLSIEELLYISYVKYPRYVSLATNNFCEIEDVIDEIVSLREQYNKNRIFRLKINFFGKSAVLLRKLIEIIR